MARIRRMVLAAGWLCVAGLGAPTAAQQQAADGDGEAKKTVNVFQLAPSDVRKPLLRAKRAIDERNYADAAFELGRLLSTESTEEAEAQDYFVFESDSEAEVGRVSLKGEAHRLLASLPAEGRRAYELQYGAQARALLDEALAEGNQEKLADVIGRFLHTKAGYEASLLAGRFELGCGRPMAAALHLQRVAGAPAASDFEPELSLLLATCWLYAEMPDKAQATLVALKKKLPGETLQLGDRPLKLFAEDAQALGWFQELIGERHPILPAELTEWVMFRGDAQRNGKARGSLPLIHCRWRVPTCIDRSDEKIVESLGKQHRDEGRAALPALQPLAVGETILMRTPRKLLGVDFASGKRIWVWPPWEDETVESLYGNLNAAQVFAATREQEVQQRIWDDAAFGQLSSDGRSVFLIHNLGYAPTANYSPHAILIAQGGLARRAPGAPSSENQLVSLSLAKQGAAQWIVGGESGEDEPKLAGAFFLGPPLPLRGRLYALAEFNGEVRLVVLDAKNGRLLWQQQLVHVDNSTIQVDGNRRLAGASPSFEGGVLLCPTSAGALVAVDIATRTLLWGYQYLKQPAQPQHQGFGIVMIAPRTVRPLGQRWADATVTAVDGRAILTPCESDELHCLDLFTGQPVWPAQPREDRLYLACVQGGNAVFVGTSKVSAIRLADGKPAWSSDLPLTDPPSGRGISDDKVYYLPTAGSEILKIDLEQGRVLLRSPTGTILGNLVAFRDEILAQGPDWLSTFYQSEPLARRVEGLLAKNPADLEALARYGELQLAQGNRDAAIETLQKVITLNPDDDTTRGLLLDTLLGALETDFAAYRDRADEIQQLSQNQPARRGRFLRVMARGWQQQGEIAKAFDAYRELARLKDEWLAGGAAAELELETVERRLNVRTDRWLTARFGELLAAADATQREAIEQSIRQAREQALADGQAAALRRFLRFYATHPGADEIRLRLAARLIETGELLEAELLLDDLLNRADSTLHPEALGRLAGLLETGRQFEAAYAAYQQLADQFGQQVCLDGKTGRQLLDEALGRAAIQEARRQGEAWPAGKVEFGENLEQINRYPSYRRVYACQVRQRTGTSLPGLSVFYDQHPNALIVRDGRGNTLATINLGTRRLNTSDFGLTHVRIQGHLVVVAMGMELLSLDLLQAARNPSAPILWRKDLIRPQPGVMMYQAHIQVLPVQHPWGDSRRVFADGEKRLLGVTGPLSPWGVYFVQLRELICADPLTGETIWSRDGVPQGSDLFGDHELLFLVPPGSKEATVYSAIDGRELGVRPVEELDFRWTTSGRRVLAWKPFGENNDQLQLRLYDAWSGQDLWHEVVPSDTKATLVDDDEVALVQPGGRCLIRSLRDDRVRLQADLQAEKGLMAIYVVRSEDQYLLVTNRAVEAEQNARTAQIRTIVGGLVTPLITGNAFAFDRRTGKATWPQPAAIERYGFPVDQPSEMPVLMFLRHYRLDPARNDPRQHTSLLCLDRRDGRQLLEKGDIPAQTYTYDVIADRLKQTVTFTLPGKSVELKFTDQPQPPPTPETPAEPEKPPTPQPAAPQPVPPQPQPAPEQPAPPQPAATQPAAPQPAAPQPVAPQPAAPQPAPPQPQPAPEQPAAPQPQPAPQPATPQPAAQ